MKEDDYLACFFMAAIGLLIGYWLADRNGAIIGFFIGAVLAAILLTAANKDKD